MRNNIEWIKTKDYLPPENVLVKTKIDDGDEVRNNQELKRVKNLWYVADGSVYVYYVPTQFRFLLIWKINLNMKTFLKTKRMRRLIKQYRIVEKRRAKADGVWRKPQTKLCSECDPLNCICQDNQRHSERIELYRKLNA